MSPPRLLVTGGSGFLGARVVQQARTLFEVLATFLSRPCRHGVSLEIRDRDAVDRLFADFGPRVVIHTAYEKSSVGVIVNGSANIARASAACGARLIHLSTDLVFGGAKGMYAEEDSPDPVIPYGIAKRDAELAVSEACPAALLVRTSLIYGLAGDDAQSRTVLDGIAAGTAVTLFTDEYRSPVLVDDLSSALLELADLPVRGPLHVAGSERLSRHELGVLIARRHGADESRLVSSTIAASGTLRPPDCSLDCSRAQSLLRTRLRGAREVLSGKAA